MTMSDEHDDDIEPEVIEGAEIERETYEVEEDDEEKSLQKELTDPSDGAKKDKSRRDAEPEEPEDEASDTI